MLLLVILRINERLSILLLILDILFWMIISLCYYDGLRVLCWSMTARKSFFILINLLVHILCFFQSDLQYAFMVSDLSTFTSFVVNAT